MTVSAIVVNYHTSSLLKGLCSSVRGQDPLSELIIVNNCPEEISVRELTEAGGIPVRVLQNDTNLGFGAAVNRALKVVEENYALIINPDARLMPGCVEAMVDACEEYSSPLAGPRFYWDDEKIFRLPPATGDSLWFGFGTESAGHFDLDAQLLSFYWILRHDRFWSMNEPFFEPFLSGACLLVSTSWAGKMGNKLFDERFFLYYEDTDLCVRAMAQGISPLCVPLAGVIHYWDQSPCPSLSKAGLMGKARSLYMQKHYGGSHYLKEVRDRPGQDWKKTDIECGINLPVFDTGIFGAGCSDLYLEFGLNSFFVPFAQARVVETDFSLPASIWNRLFPGDYFFRLRSQTSGTKKIWKWNKK